MTATLVAKHRTQIMTRNPHHEPWNVVGLSIEPGDNTSTFRGKHFLPLNSPLIIVQHSSRVLDKKGRKHGAVDCRGYRSAINPSTGAVVVGTAQESKFCYDLGYPCYEGARGRQFDPFAKPSNMRTLGVLLEMDKVRQRAMTRGYQLQALNHVVLPEYYLGFGEGQLPAWEASAGFVQLVLRHLRRPAPANLWALSAPELKALIEDVPEALLEDLWQGCFIAPHHAAQQPDEPASGNPLNTTSHWLIDHKFCSKANTSLRNYEGVSKLLGAEVWNPAVEVLPTKGSILLPNPAQEVTRSLKTDHVEELVAAFRQRLGEAVGKRVSDESICRCLEHPDQPLDVPQGSQRLRATELPQDLLAKAMRAALEPRVSECTTDQDLLAAARSPGDRLFASGMAKIQLFRVRANSPEEFVFGPKQLGRPKVTVDFWSVQEWYYGGQRDEAVLPSE